MKFVSKIAFGAVALAAMGGTAMAADLMAPPPPAAAVMTESAWTGGYLGVRGSDTFASGDSVYALDAVIGADFQSDMFLVGLQGWLGGFYDTSSTSTGYDYGAEGRVGFIAGDSAAIYGSLGAQAYSAGARYWTAGLGVEFKLADNLGLDLEYKHLWPTAGGTQADSVGASLLWHFH